MADKPKRKPKLKTEDFKQELQLNAEAFLAVHGIRPESLEVVFVRDEHWVELEFRGQRDSMERLARTFRVYEQEGLVTLDELMNSTMHDFHDSNLIVWFRPTPLEVLHERRRQKSLQYKVLRFLRLA